MSAVLLSSGAPPRGYTWTSEKLAELRAFVSDVLPAGGAFALAHLKRPDRLHRWFSSGAELIDAFIASSDDPDLYFATASYKAKGTACGGRTQANVMALRAFRVDIDVGPAKVFKTLRDAVTAVAGFHAAGGPLPSYILLSGGKAGGLHVYWCLAEDIAPGLWKPVAQHLHRAAEALGLAPDPAVTSDEARVLRLPGAVHGKSGERTSILKRTGALYALHEIAAQIGALQPWGDAPAFAAPTSLIPRRKVNRPLNAEAICDDFADRPPAQFPNAVARCAALRSATENEGASAGEPLWRGMLGIAKHCADGAKHAHEASRGHAGYDPVETQAKFDKWDAGPTTCAYFEACAPMACVGCGHRGEIKSPIMLGYAVERPALLVATTDGDANPPLTIDAESGELEQLNTKHFVAPDGAGKPAIWQETTDPETGLYRVVPLSRAEFMLAHENQVVTVPRTGGGTQRVPVAAWWLRHKQRREYPGGMALLPEGNAPVGVFNLFRGLGVVPVPGDVDPMMDHLDMLCAGDTAIRNYLVGWLAHCVQRPGSRPEVAVVLRGGQGTGKGTLARLMLQLFGAHGLHITQQAHLVGHFNAHLRHALFVFVDEGYWAGDRAAEGVLKGLITEPTIAVEMKGRDVFPAPNRLKLMIASNSTWVIPAGADERRYCVVDVPTTKAQDHAYFGRLNAWAGDGGASAWLDYLQRYDLRGFNVRAAPSSAALDRQKIENLPPLDRWLLEALDQATGLGGGEWLADGSRVVCAAAVHAFADYCQRAGGRRASADARVIGARLHHVFACGPSRTSQAGPQRAKAWVLPGIDRARALAAAAFGLAHHEWSDP